MLRGLFLAGTPDLSVDPFRYVWDGWLSTGGVNPYRFTPSDPELAHRHGTLLFGEMNSRDFFSIYPPLSQWLFVPAGLAFERWGWTPAFVVLKATFTAAEFAGVVLLYRALRHFSVAPRWLALYAWNPLALVTVAGVGHSEGGLVLALGLLALGLSRQGSVTAWAGLWLAVVSKGVPLLAAPLLFRHHRLRLGTAATLKAVALGAAPALVLSLPFVFAGLPARVVASADLYVRLFEFNAGLYALLRTALDPLTGWYAGAVLGPALRWVMLGAAILIWWRHPAAGARDVLSGMVLLMGLYLVTATTVHPWYLLWGLPLVPLVRRHRAAWLWASWAAFATYFAYTPYFANFGAREALLAGLFWGGVAAALAVEEGDRLRDVLLRLAGRRKARQIAPHVVGRSVLDLGAGEGYVGQHLVAGVGTGGGPAGGAAERRTILADVAPSFRTPLPAFVYDGRQLPLADGAVDTVVLSLVLHHAREPDRVLAEALRVARRRVVMTESTFRYGWERRLLETVDGLVNRGRGSGPMATGHEPLRFETVEGWEARVEAMGGRLVLSRRLNRLGHRHHLFVVDPP